MGVLFLVAVAISALAVIAGGVWVAVARHAVERLRGDRRRIRKPALSEVEGTPQTANPPSVWRINPPAKPVSSEVERSFKDTTLPIYHGYYFRS
jgi:hypothetical protein